jgi:enamine deaminase RidA (YjgF/YER057c/UK114 family)
MVPKLFTRRNFAARLAAVASGLGIARLFAPNASPAQEAGAPRKLDYDGKPAPGTQMITPLIVHGGLIYIAGQGAHSHNEGDFPMDITTHTTKVMDSVKTLVEAGGGTMDSILQLTVFLAKIDDYDERLHAIHHFRGMRGDIHREIALVV